MMKVHLLKTKELRLYKLVELSDDNQV